MSKRANQRPDLTRTERDLIATSETVEDHISQEQATRHQLLPEIDKALPVSPIFSPENIQKLEAETKYQGVCFVWRFSSVFI
jgi:hypothetical protein